jgi:hypothetical protein
MTISLQSSNEVEVKVASPYQTIHIPLPALLVTSKEYSVLRSRYDIPLASVIPRAALVLATLVLRRSWPYHSPNTVFSKQGHTERPSNLSQHYDSPSKLNFHTNNGLLKCGYGRGTTCITSLRSSKHP